MADLTGGSRVGLVVLLLDRCLQPLKLRVDLALVAWPDVRLQHQRDPRPEREHGLGGALHHVEALVPGGAFEFSEHRRRPVQQAGVSYYLPRCGTLIEDTTAGTSHTL